VRDQSPHIELARLDDAQGLLEAVRRVGEHAVDAQVLEGEDVGIEEGPAAATGNALENDRATTPYEVESQPHRGLHRDMGASTATERSRCPTNARKKRIDIAQQAAVGSARVPQQRSRDGSLSASHQFHEEEADATS
jgi:hypothetical protein